jgi:hypothetical protein
MFSGGLILIILLQEVRDYDACTRLGEAIAPGIYHVAICSAFKEPFQSGLGKQQVAILSKYQAQAAWAERWKSMNGVDPPRGFAFAWFKIGSQDMTTRPALRHRAARRLSLWIAHRRLCRTRFHHRATSKSRFRGHWQTKAEISGSVMTSQHSCYDSTGAFPRFYDRNERATGIEPAWPAWKAGTLPLSYARV